MTSSVKREAYGFKGALLIIHCKRNPKQGHFVVHNSCTVLGVGGGGLVCSLDGTWVLFSM
jgi:hypothetical protein